MEMIGRTISHYKILEKLGEGGMGVVYKAKDIKLDRFVALKFLPPHTNSSGQDKARFIQEAKAAATLNHPNICTIHDIQVDDGQVFIVMELIEGETLKEKSGNLSIKQAIDIAIQIADGLAAAHEKGVVHRDIKPENIMIRKDGIVQIMDFGLAKLRAAESRINRLTKEGSTVGTAGYMSPEQVQGQDTDHRSDIFSYGVVVYEMITGQLPFRGVHDTALAYEIVNVDPPPMASAKPEIDPALDAIVLECLEKDVYERAQSLKQVAVDLRRYKRESGKQRASRITAAGPRVRSPLAVSSVDGKSPEIKLSRRYIYPPWIIASIFIVISIVLGILYFRPSSQELQVIRSSILAPERSSFFMHGGGHLALSPDGRILTFIARDSAGKSALWVRSLSSFAGQPLIGTEGAEYPFWSPDGRFIGFFADGKMKKVEASGGPVQILADAASGRGGTWNRADVILFAPNAASGICQTSASGGPVKTLTKFDSLRREDSHRWPFFLPDGRHFLFLGRTTKTGAGDQDLIYLASLDSAEKTTTILPASSNITYSAGYLLFVREQSLMAQAFDAAHLRLTGDAVPVAEHVQYDPSVNKAIFSSSENGMLVYQTGIAGGGRQLAWFDRGGKRLVDVGKAGDYLDVRLSPDSRRVAVALFEPQSRNYDIWLYEFQSDVWSRFTFDPALERFPVWSPDGSRIAFASSRYGHLDIFQKSSSGAGSEELLFESTDGKFPTGWSSDGTMLLFTSRAGLKTKDDLWAVSISKERKAFPLLQTEFNESGGVLSPDRKWIAYQSDESGTNQVYVRPYPGPGGKWQISTTGGTRPHWRGDGKEIFYLSEDGRLMAVEVKTSSSAFEVGQVQALLAVNLFMNIDGSAYDVTPDGRRFLLNTLVEDITSPPIMFVSNWDGELKKKRRTD